MLYMKALKLAGNPVLSRLSNLESKLSKVSFGSLQLFTVHKIGDFPHFLPALACNNQFIINLVKMWPGGASHVVVGILKISLKKKRSLVECCSVSCCE